MNYFIVPINFKVPARTPEEAAEMMDSICRNQMDFAAEIGEPYLEPVVPDPEDPEFFHALTAELQRLQGENPTIRLQLAHATLNELNQAEAMTQAIYGRIHACHTILLMARQEAQGAVVPATPAVLTPHEGGW
jgi:hypothetical protein